MVILKNSAKVKLVDINYKGIQHSFEPGEVKEVSTSWWGWHKKFWKATLKEVNKKALGEYHMKKDVEGTELHPNVLKALSEAGITADEAKKMTVEELVEIKGIGEATAKKIVE